MEKTVTNSSIKEFAARLEKDLGVEKISGMDPGKLAEFNMELYKNEFNAERYADRAKILKFWDWKYRENPASKSEDNFGWVVTHKSEPVGQWHIIPADIKIGRADYKCAWGSDLAILKKYRNVGISAFLIQRAKKEVGEDFALFLLGGMNLNSYNIFKRSGFIDVGKVPRYIRILDLKEVLMRYGMPAFFAEAAGKLANLAYKMFSTVDRRDNTISVETAKAFGSEFEEFWNSVSGHYACIIKRNLKFLRWRYANQPLWPYTILKATRQDHMKAFAVLREGDIKNGRLKGAKIGIVSDILIDPEDKEATMGLLKAIEDFFKSKRALLVKCDVLNAHVEKVLAGAGYLRIKPQNEFMLNIHPKHMKAEDAELASLRKNWFISSGDSDFDYY